MPFSHQIIPLPPSNITLFKKSKKHKMDEEGLSLLHGIIL